MCVHTFSTILFSLTSMFCFSCWTFLFTDCGNVLFILLKQTSAFIHSDALELITASLKLYHLYNNLSHLDSIIRLVWFLHVSKVLPRSFCCFCLLLVTEIEFLLVCQNKRVCGPEPRPSGRTYESRIPTRRSYLLSPGRTRPSARPSAGKMEDGASADPLIKY